MNIFPDYFIQQKDGALWAGSFWTYVPMFAKPFTESQAKEIIRHRFVNMAPPPRPISETELHKKRQRKILPETAARYCARWDDSLIIEGNENADGFN